MHWRSYEEDPEGFSNFQKKYVELLGFDPKEHQHLMLHPAEEQQEQPEGETQTGAHEEESSEEDAGGEVISAKSQPERSCRQSGVFLS